MFIRVSFVPVVVLALWLAQGAAPAATEEAPPVSALTAEAVARAEAAAAVAPQNAERHAELSRAYATAGRVQDSLKEINRALELRPDNKDYHLARIQLANWAGNTELAGESCARVLQLDPGNAEAMLASARVLKFRGKLDSSARAYKRYVKAYPADSAARIEYAQVEAWKGNFDKAVRILDEYEKRFGKGPVVDQQRARFMASADKPRTALEINEKVTVTPENNFELGFTRVVALHHNNQPKAAAGALDELEALRPGNPETAGLRSYVHAGARSNVELEGRRYSDSDKLTIVHSALKAGLKVRDGLRIKGWIEDEHLRAKAGSGLENLDGSRRSNVSKGWVGIESVLSPRLSVELAAGVGHTEETQDSDFLSQASVRARPVESLVIKGSIFYDYLLISPRAVSYHIRRTGGLLQGEWRPDLLYTVVASGSVDDYTDGNQRVEGILAPRRAVARTRWLNSDLGVRALWLGFSEDLNSGYYDPQRYKQFSLTLMNYLKTSAGSGMSISGAAGYYKDETMDDFEFGWSVDAEFTVGAFNDWMLKVNGATIRNLRQQPNGAFSATAAGLSITRRF